SADPDETLRHLANRFATSGAGTALVIDPRNGREPIGAITLADLLEARLRDHHEEHVREHVRERVLAAGLRRRARRRGPRREAVSGVER
ncbi:MAG: hypothetical protein ABI323_13650, partial [Solirubrobacteraceae bacterium]